MNIVIDDFYGESFANSIPKYIYSVLKNKKVNVSIYNSYKDEFGIDLNNVILALIDSLVVRHTNNKYIIEIDKNKFYNGENIEKLVNIMTYGSRTVKGYTAIMHLFETIQNNIQLIYRRWRSSGY